MIATLIGRVKLPPIPASLPTDLRQKATYLPKFPLLPYHNSLIKGLKDL